ncbi:MAG: hypothetical protein COW34_04435 [Armatimonadetes bacterium CG17_big_fil_post_rev_8_21_14_2_50_66_6]|nr:MAG: hypothetical protein COW34_04435 [Armatimonadetes bacterium CG17_big_fil_post_rev_8_21_14_2_50_66_6]
MWTTVCQATRKRSSSPAGKTAPEDIAQVLLDHGVDTVGIKMGGEGCYVQNSTGSVRLPVCQVDALDATGAGDAFVAGFLTGVVKGWDLEATARFANAVGASCVTALGASAGIRSFEETMALADTLK